MIATNYSGQAVRILQASPNWAAGVVSSHELLIDATQGLSNRESRRPHSAALRTRLSYTALVADQDLRRLVGVLDTIGTEPVLCPFWPAQRPWSARAASPIQGGLKLAWKVDWSTWELFTDVEPGWPLATDNWAPVLWGFLGDRGLVAGARWYNSRLADLAASFTEDGPAEFALMPAAGIVAAGPMPPAGYATAPRLLPVLPNFDRLAEDFSLRVDRTRTSFRRQNRPEFYPQAPARLHQLDYQLSSAAAVAQLMAFWRDYAGRGASFWAPSWVGAAELTEDVAAIDTELDVVDTLAVSVGDYIALVTSAGLIGRRVTAKSGTSLTLDAAVGAAVPKTALVTQLFLARAADQRLALDWTHSDLADTTLQVRELPPEYSPAADETVGTTLGLLPGRCYLYDFIRDHGGVLVHDRYTSYETDVTYGGHTWVSSDVSHGSIQQGLALEENRAELSGAVFAGSPLVAMAALRTEVPIRLTIMSADVSAGVATNVVILATGEVDGASLRGDQINGSLSPGGRLLAQQAPRFEVGPPCNHSLFSPGCGLARADWVHTALVNGAPSAAYPFTLSIDTLARTTGPAPTYFADWFAHGWVEVGTPGTAGWQRRWILTSTSPAGGALTLTLHKAFDPLPADNAAVTLYPGCDLTAESCKSYDAGTNPRGKFGNYAAFGGHPFVPPSNPSLVKISSDLGGGKK